MECYAVVYVGCIECGVPTELVGIFTSREEAEAASQKVESGGDSWNRHGGEGFLELFGPVPVGAFTDPGRGTS